MISCFYAPTYVNGPLWQNKDKLMDIKVVCLATFCFKQPIAVSDISIYICLIWYPIQKQIQRTTEWEASRLVFILFENTIRMIWNKSCAQSFFVFAGYHPYNTYSYYDETKGIFLVTCNTEKDKNTFSSPSPSLMEELREGIVRPRCLCKH